jgi:hypothetical protein
MWVCLTMVSVLTVLRSLVRDAALVPSPRRGSRKEVPMRHKIHRLFRTVRVAMLDTFWAIGASYMAGSLPT